MQQTINETHLESKGYRLLFECAKNEGVENLYKLIESLADYTYLNDKIIEEICTKNQISKYLLEYKKDLKGIYIKSLKSLLNIIINNPSILTIFIENAKKLETLKINEIDLVSKEDILNNIHHCNYFIEEFGVTSIYKPYTDGLIIPISKTQESIHFEASYKIKHNEKVINSPTFLLYADNRINHHLQEFRHIQINSFDFNSSYLPSDEELSSYEIPSCFRLTK